MRRKLRRRGIRKRRMRRLRRRTMRRRRLRRRRIRRKRLRKFGRMRTQLAEYISQILLKYYIPTIEMLVK